MYIKKIILKNYRIYYDSNQIEFSQDRNKNVFIISGNNGYGKTTLLSSLVWCLYGKLMISVDDKFRKEIYESGGYKKYASANLNRLAANNGFDTYKVTIVLGEVFIPSLPCNELTISRSFNSSSGEESVSILIDGSPNELTREVGSEIFINDFVLPKEIAKFFFFDAEKIVSLAEIKTIEEKRSLSKAYSEVLGIKKYEDLKEHLQDLRIRFRRNSASEDDKEKFEELQKEINQHKKLIQEYAEQISILHEEKISKKQASEQYQEKLIREGNAISVDELNDLKRIKQRLTEEADMIKNKMKDFLELAPFALAANLMVEVRGQLIEEISHSQKVIDPVIVRKKASQIKFQIIENSKELGLNNRQATKLSDLVFESIFEYFTSETENQKDFKILLNFSDSEKSEFDAIFSNLKNSFSHTFRQLVNDHKNNRIYLNKVIRKISNAESKENDLLIKEIRSQKQTLDKRIEEIDVKLEELNQEIGGLQKEITIRSRIISELAKKIDLEKADRIKDETAKRLIEELSELIIRLKNEKKHALEHHLKEELNNLMHKTTFISRVEVLISEEFIDINLFNRRGEMIVKDTLSKGEQQLYATALLKALVDESNINFSVFIDSPLQKFDIKHSRNIIFSFYPKISEQVVLFPLLEKELTEAEYKVLLPKINKAYLIRNIDEDRSAIVPVEPSTLFIQYKDQNAYVYTH